MAIEPLPLRARRPEFVGHWHISLLATYDFVPSHIGLGLIDAKDAARNHPYQLRNAAYASRIFLTVRAEAAIYEVVPILKEIFVEAPDSYIREE